MDAATTKNALISGASIAGLATAYWLSQLGYHVTVVERAPEPRLGGAAINLQGPALAAAKRMGILEQLLAHRLQLERWEFKNAADETVGHLDLLGQDASRPGEDPADIEIEREKLLPILLAALPAGVEFRFGTYLTALHDTPAAVQATFADGTQRAFELVVGCDGLHSGVRRLWFGPEAEYVQFLQHYFSLTVVPKSLIAQGTAQMYNVPGKSVMLNAYQQKTDIAFCFFTETEIPYDYRNAAQQQALIAEQFTGLGWRTAELLADAAQAPTAYFDKFSQTIMPCWTKGRVALVGDAGYCASPAAGIGASLALAGAAALADALAAHDDQMAVAFAAYNQQFRPWVEEVQATARFMLREYLVPQTEAAIHARNTQPFPTPSQ